MLSQYLTNMQECQTKMLQGKIIKNCCSEMRVGSIKNSSEEDLSGN